MVESKPDIVETLQREGVELKQRGGRLWACCPLHSERTPSFCVDTDKQRFKCFGCAISGDVVDFVQKLKGLTFPGALSYLGISGGDSRPARPSAEEIRRRELVQRFNEWCTNYAKWIGEMLRRCNEIDVLILTPEQLDTAGLTEMYLARDFYQHHLDILNNNDDEPKFKLFEEFYGRDKYCI